MNWDRYSVDLCDPSVSGFDAVVVGAGLAGSVVGYDLARQGFRVLFLECGRPSEGQPPQSRFHRIVSRLRMDRSQALAAQGRWSKTAKLLKGKRYYVFYPILGCGPGGSSAVYGAALARFKREDFADHTEIADEILPISWPITYEDFVPYYQKAEDLMGICGTNDPLDPDNSSALKEPPPLSELDQYFFKSFQQLGLHPFRQHIGIEFRPGCAECIGRVCPRGCKADGLSRALTPALERYGARIAFDCTVDALESQQSKVTAVIARTSGQTIRIRAPIIILAAGALCTPNILRSSISEFWPNGIGNSNDLVGRGLMFHICDLLAVWPTIPINSKSGKTLEFRDFYSVQGRKLGTVQSVGARASAHRIALFLNDWLNRNLGVNIPGIWLLLRLIAIPLVRWFAGATLFSTIMEDFPYRYNQVCPDPERKDSFIIEYRKPKELRERIILMRTLLKQKLRKHRLSILTGDDNVNYGHPCGTCRLGNDPMTSVLNSNNRVWGTENLYVVDASCFPSNGAANPSLTIVANALRVSEVIAIQLKKKNMSMTCSPETPPVLS